MKVYVDPIPELSRAMHRVADALRRHAPEGVTVVGSVLDADLQVLHVIGPKALRWVKAPRYAVIQYCLRAVADKSGRNVTALNQNWQPIWRDRVVWSYYDLLERPDAKVADAIYEAPLGVDQAFRDWQPQTAGRDIGIVSSGYVSGKGAEAIDEVAEAAFRVGLTTRHIGPKGALRMSRPAGWSATLGISDEELAGIYGRSLWVSGLRHLEGFELPVIEGLACGARPIVFDRPEMRRWYDGLAVFVPPCHGEELTDRLEAIMQQAPEPVTPAERDEVLKRFDWQPIARGFWDTLVAREESAR